MTDAERAVLAALLSDGRVYDRIGDLLAPEDFSDEEGAHIFGAAQALAQAGQPTDAVHLSEVIGGKSLARLLEIARGYGTSVNADGYAGIVKRASRLRQVHALGRRLAEAPDVQSGERDAVETLERLDGSDADGMRQVALYRGEWEAAQRQEAFGTGWSDLDGVVTFGPGIYAVAAARTSVGKSAMVRQIAHRFAARGIASALYSLEEGGSQVYGRTLSYQGDHPDASMPLYVDSTASVTAEQLFLRAKRSVRRHAVRAVFVDYLQLVTGSGDTRQQQLGHVSRTLRRIAQDLKVFVLAAAQLSRKAEDHRRPRLSDIREAGDVEQDADIVLLLHRDDRAPWPAIEVEVAKNKHGARGRFIVLRHLAERYRFESVLDGEAAAYYAAIEHARPAAVALREGL